MCRRNSLQISVFATCPTLRPDSMRLGRVCKLCDIIRARGIIRRCRVRARKRRPRGHFYASDAFGYGKRRINHPNLLGHLGIRANSISPGMTETPMAGDAFRIPAYVEAFVRSYPLGRLGTVDDIAAAAAWLADEECFMMGQNCHVNGALRSHNRRQVFPWKQLEFLCPKCLRPARN
jgi:hypothetical protein